MLVDGGCCFDFGCVMSRYLDSRMVTINCSKMLAYEFKSILPFQIVPQPWNVRYSSWTKTICAPPHPRPPRVPPTLGATQEKRHRRRGVPGPAAVPRAPLPPLHLLARPHPPLPSSPFPSPVPSLAPLPSPPLLPSPSLLSSPPSLPSPARPLPRRGRSPAPPRPVATTRETPLSGLAQAARARAAAPAPKIIH